MTSKPLDPPGAEPAGHSFRHEALLYAGQDQLVGHLVTFLREGLDAGDTTAVLLEADKIALLKEALGDDADRVHFTDAAGLGRNPARLIPWWRRFIDEHLQTDRPVRAVGAPGLTGRVPAEVDEYLAHEALLNVAFADDPPWSLLCPYDIDVMTAAVLDEFRRSHPFVVDEGRSGPNSAYQPATVPTRLDQPLTPPPADARVIGFDRERNTLRRVRAAVLDHAVLCGLDPTATDNLVLAANELVSNSLDHGGGKGALRLWRDDGVAVCEVTDEGRLAGSPLLGRQHPDLDRFGGRGLWLVNQVCDLLQIRSSPAGTTVRVHVWPPANG